MKTKKENFDRIDVERRCTFRNMKLMNAYETMKLSNRCEIINWRRWACETFVASRYSATKRHLLSVSISAPYSGPQSCTMADWRFRYCVTVSH